MDFKVNWQKLRQDSKMSQTVLAHRVGITQAYLSTIESHKNIPVLRVAAMIASACNASLDLFRHLSCFLEFAAVYHLNNCGSEASPSNIDAMEQLIEWANGERARTKKPYVSSNSLPSGDARVLRIRAQFSKVDDHRSTRDEK